MPVVLRLLRKLPLLAVLCLGGFRCDRPPERPSPPTAEPAPLGEPDLTLLILTDPKGYLEPCGCQQRPLGGVDKLAAVVAQARQQGVPTVVLAAGNLFFGAELHGADVQGAQAQERWKAETLAQVWSGLGMAAVAPGPLDFSQGVEAANQLRKQSDFPWLSVNLQGLEPPLPGSQLLEAGKLRVGVVASQAPDPGHPFPSPLELGDAEGPLKQAIEKLRQQGADLVVALHTGDRRSARRAARAGADLVVAGGLDAQDPLPPASQGEGWIVHAGRQGQSVLELDLSLSGKGALVDVSEWSLRLERRRLSAQARSLAEKIEAWEKDPKVDEANVAKQKQRLEQMRSEARSLRRPEHSGRWLSARVIELDPDVASDAKVAAQVDAYDKRVNEHNKKALADRTPEPPAEGAPHFVGSESCAGNQCHTPAVQWWKTTQHGMAYATLQEVHKEYNLSCVGCHVTGYNEPGGSTVTHVEDLTNVGCESCHGPGSQHVKAPEKSGLIALEVPEATCTECHNPQHSARFQYDGFKAMLMAPGHGMPAEKPAQGGKAAP